MTTVEVPQENLTPSGTEGVKDLRSFLDDLQQRHPEELLTISRPINAKFEVTAFQVKLERMGKFPVILCEQPINSQGDPTPHRLITNVFASRRRSADAIGVPSTEVAERYTALSLDTREPVTMAFDQAPVHQVVDRGSAVDLYRFPAVWLHEFDAGPYSTGGFFTTIDPESGQHNSSVQRAWIKAKNKTGIYMQANSDNRRNVLKWWARGEAAPVAIWLGHHPAVYLGCQSYGRIPYPQSHYRPVSRVPREVYEQMELRDYVSAESVANIPVE